jgi:type III secretion system chaperone SycN
MAHSLQQALADLGRDIDLPLLETKADGGVQLRLESGALLGVAQEGEAIVVHWAEPVRYDIAALLLRAMKQSGDVRDAAQPVQVGLRSTPSGDWLVLATRFAADEVSARRIREASEFLRQWFASLGGAH